MRGADLIALNVQVNTRLRIEPEFKRQRVVAGHGNKGSLKPIAVGSNPLDRFPTWGDILLHVHWSVASKITTRIEYRFR